MKNKLSTEFNTRQYMTASDYEIFYYHDSGLKQVSSHRHDHYEIYYFLEGDTNYVVEECTYALQRGDYLMIPPGKRHKPLILDDRIPYRRIVLWLSREYYARLCSQSEDFSFGYDYALQNKQYHFRHDFIVTQDIHGKLLELLEEIRSNHAFHELHCTLKTAGFLAYINRIISEQVTASPVAYDVPLYARLCDYITSHLAENLSLDELAKEFFVSKYHIAHIFKQHMGLGLHQYIMKKRLSVVKSGIPSGIPLTQLAHDFGFSDYTSFYRAFKREYGISPQEYRKEHRGLEDYKEI